MYWSRKGPRQVVDCENNELLSADGTTAHLAGFLRTSGMLTHTVDSSEIPLDAVETSIAALCTGPAPAEANIPVPQPNTWSATRKQKDS
jgi:hypothetical protein